MISYGWGNKVEDICAVLMKYCNDNDLDVKRTYVWICCLCNNQFQVDEQSDVPFEEFEKIFEDKVVGIKNIVSLMSPWNSPVYLTRVWCIFELHKAHTNGCNLMIAMPPEEESKMIESVLAGENADEGTGGVHDLFDALKNTNIQQAQASREDDRKHILQMVEESTGALDLNNQVNEMLRKWIRKTLDDFAARESVESEDDEAEQIRLSQKLNQIGLVYDNQGEYDKALEYYERAHSIKEMVLGADHPDLATTYNNIGSMHDNKGDYIKALDCYKKARDIQKNHPDHYNSLANIYNNIGLVYDNQDDYEKALENYTLCKDIRMSLFGKDHLSLANVYNNIGSVYDKQGNFDNAFEYYDKARIIEEKYYGKNHPQLATTYNNIGLVYNNQGDSGRALQYYEKARIVEEKIFGKDHPDIAATYNNIGGVYDNEGEYDMALNYYKMAFEIEQKCLGEDHLSLASTCSNIGGVYNDLGDYDRAIEYYEMTLKIQENVLGQGHPELVSTLTAIGAAYNNKGIYDVALTYHRKAKNIQETMNGKKDDPEYAYILNNIAGVHMRQGENSMALTCFEKALTILKHSLGNDHVNTVAVSESIAYLTLLKS